LDSALQEFGQQGRVFGAPLMPGSTGSCWRRTELHHRNLERLLDFGANDANSPRQTSTACRSCLLGWFDDRDSCP
jgi:hypothetical protein